MTTTPRPLPFVTTDATLGYTDTGEGAEPILLIHAGLFADWLLPLSHEAALTPFRIIRVVRAGYGDAPAPTGPTSIADHADQSAALLGNLGANPAHVVAHSSGCAIAMALAHRHPDAVQSLVLSEPPLIDALVDPDDITSLHEAVGPVFSSVMASAGAGEVGAAYDTFMGAICGPDHRAVVSAALGADGLARAERESSFFFADEMGAVASWEPDPVSPVADAPVLIVVGGESPRFTHRLAAHLATRIDGAGIATLDGDNHLLPLRSPGALAGLVADFVGEHAVAASDGHAGPASPVVGVSTAPPYRRSRRA